MNRQLVAFAMVLSAVASYFLRALPVDAIVSVLAPPADATKTCEGFACVEQYIDAVDSTYSWRKLPGQINGTLDGVKWTGFIMSLKSQKWLSRVETDRQVWSHPLVVIMPEGILINDTWVNLVVGGAGTRRENFNGSASPKNPDVRAAVELAVRTRTLSAALLQVPNQPITFRSDPVRLQRMEDAIKAYTWRLFEDNTVDPTIIIELPMAKAVVRAMDAVTEFSRGLNMKVAQFGLAGCSKRAISVMMACAHDARCKLLMPCAMTGNGSGVFIHNMRSLGEPPFSMIDYWREGVFKDVGSKASMQLNDIVDAGNFLERLTMPKLWLNGPSDTFFPPDHTFWFWSTLPGPKTLYQKLNGDHVGSIGDPAYLTQVVSFTQGFLAGERIPEIKWLFDETSNILTVEQTSGSKPKSVAVYSARTCLEGGRRDFRFATLDTGPACWKCGRRTGAVCSINATRWSKVEELRTDTDHWRLPIDVPKQGWRGIFLQFEFPAQQGQTPITVSTEVIVVPRWKYPFPDCRSPEGVARGGCRGKRLIGQIRVLSDTNQTKTEGHRRAQMIL